MPARTTRPCTHPGVAAPDRVHEDRSVMHSPQVLLQVEVTFDRAPSSELVRLAGDLGELGDWELEPRGDEEVWSMTCVDLKVLLIVSLVPLEPDVGEARSRRWLLTAGACEVGEPWRLALARLPRFVDDWRPWIAGTLGFGLVTPAAVLVDGHLDVWSLAVLALVAAGASTWGISVVLHRVVERHRSRQRALLLANPTARKLVELLGARAKP